jgi:hypothetical protein
MKEVIISYRAHEAKTPEKNRSVEIVVKAESHSEAHYELRELLNSDTLRWAKPHAVAE